MKMTGISFVLFAVGLITLEAISVSGAKSYGEYCTKRKDCDQELGLSCQQGICECDSDTTVFSDASQRCVIKIGRRCHENGKNDTMCVDHGECKKLRVRHWCRCKDGYVESADGTACTPIVKYGEFCNDQNECDKKSGTECIEGNCQCPFREHQYFDQYEGKCISFAGGNCSIPSSSPCVKNAECVNVEVRTGFTELGVKKIHTKSVTQCLCKKGFSKAKNALCMASAGTECSAMQPCNYEDYLTCVDGKCKCRNPLHQIINGQGQCVNLVGTQCQENEGPQCVDNADCVNSRCTCRSGYSVTGDKTCLLSYKELCQPNQCNKFSGLACVNSYCECFDSFLVYDEDAKACVSVSSKVQ